MAAAAVGPQSNGVAPTDPAEREAWEISQYEKIIEIRDQVFAGTHPRLRLLYPDTIRDDDSDDDEPVAVVPPKNPGTSQKPGSITQPVNASQNLSAIASSSHLLPPPPPPPPSAQPSKPANAPAAGAGASGIDPIFLTKSDVLLRAETQQKRQRIERVLADQVKEKQRLSKQKAHDQDDLPDFDVSEVLKKAQELVKPVKVDLGGANGNASASDSFDENTFYSSQMNDSTPEPIEKPEPFQKQTAAHNCNYYIRGDNCPYGEQCIYAHDPAIKRRGQGQKQQPDAATRNHADTQAQSRPRNAGQQQTSKPNSVTKPLTQAERIAELEAQLQALKSVQADKPVGPPKINTRNGQEAQEEEPVYSPPDALPPKPSEVALGKRKDVGQQQRRTSAQVEGSSREYPHRQNAARSPVINDGRVVRNHITSPVAPQPARVSPLAVAKAPAIAQGQRQQRQINDSFREAANGTSPAQQSHAQQQTSNPKKRKRGHESGERVRNVATRREPPSPEIQIKDEPMSPPPFTGQAERWQPRRLLDDRAPIYVDDVSPRYQDQEDVIYRPRVIDRPAPRYALDDYRGPRPPTYEPDLRRVVNTRQAQVSLADNERYPSPQAPAARAVSQAYIPRHEYEIPRQYRPSIQPEAAPYVERDLAPSPRFREAPTTMAPPPRRIIVDQHGNQFYEQEVAPMLRPRQSSAVPYVRQAPPERAFQSSASRHSIARIPQPVEDGSRYTRRDPSPTSPRYIEYVSPTHNRQPAGRDMDMFYGDDRQPRRTDGLRVVEYPPSQTHGRYEEIRPMEGITRVSSVRPVSHHYEGGPERVSRVQSVHPEGRRVVTLGGGEIMPQGARHMSLRPDDGYGRQVEYIQPRMQYYPGTDGRG
ncbi:MAG: hypothetical protein LQ338_006968 [Usnochroma carphineum]|nr:MAG: hypothetical protein LQ338_006968 [Usnochroma carphineum]